MNRTRAKPFNEQYENSFEFLTKVPFHGLRYEAVFEKKRVLRWVFVRCFVLCSHGITHKFESRNLPIQVLNGTYTCLR